MRRILFLLWALPMLVMAQNYPTETTTLPAPTTVNVSDLAQYELINPPIMIARDFEEDEEEKPPIDRMHTVTAVDEENTVKFNYDFSSWRAASPSPTLDFNGLDDDGTSIPPDVHGAAGPNHLMVTLNTQYRIMDRTGSVISTVSADGFWAGTGGTNPSTFDPKIFYDNFNSRWVLVSCANAQASNSALLVAVTQTNDPTGNWNRFLIDADNANTNWFDYPSLGINKDWIVVSGNMFTNSGNNFTGGKIWVLNKTNAYAGSSAGLTTINAGNGVFTLSPALTYDNSISTVYLVQEFNNNSGGNAFLEIYTLTGATPTLASQGTCSTNLPYNWDGTSGAPQSGSANKIATNDSRIQNVVYRGGSLYITHNIYLPVTTPTRNSIQWWKVNATTRAVEQAGRIDDATGATHYCFPSIMPNSLGDVILSFSQFSSTTFASAAYALRYASDPVNTFNNTLRYKAGANIYFKTFGGASNRWGDYTAACLDPDGTTFWVISEYARSTVNTWGTWWAEVIGTPGLACVSAPTGLASSNITSSTATVSWGAVAGAVSYNLSYKPSSSGNFTTVNTASTSFGLTGLTASTTYDFKVQAVCSSSSSPFSSLANFTTSAAACVTAPTGLNATNITSTTATLGWTASAGAVSYNIQYKTSAGSVFTTVTSATNSVAISGLTSNTAYDYKVQAVCSSSSSPFSAIANFTTAVAPCTNAPTGLGASSVTSTSALLGWTAAAGAVSYNIQYKTTAGAVFTTVTSATNSKSITGLTPNTSYDFKVQTVCSASSSPYSGISTFVTLPASCVDVGEPNNSLATASAISLNTNLAAQIASAVDLDYYIFTTTALQNLTITLSALPADYDMKLYNAAGTQVGSSYNTGATNEVMTYVNAPIGSYKIFVYSKSGAFNASTCYTLNVTTAAASNCTNANEPNESMAAAKVLIPNIDIKGQIASSVDLDYYKFTLTASSSIIATLKTLPADFDIKIFNSAGTQIAIGHNAGTTNETVSFPNLGYGTYYLLVYGYNGAFSTTACYTLKVAASNGSFSPIDNGEGNDQPIVNDIQLVPNPASENVTVFYTHTIDEVVRLKIFDQAGREVRVYNVSLMNQENKFDLDLTDFAEGIYSVQIQGNNWTKSQKLVVVGN